MIEKIEKLLDVGIEALTEVRNHYARLNGAELPLNTKAAAPAQEEQPAAKPPRQPRKKKEAPEAALPPIAQPAGDAFGLGEPAAPPADAEAASKKFQQLGAAFIQRHKNDKPTGLERFKAICNEVCQRPVAQLADMNFADHVKLIARFEKELAAA